MSERRLTNSELRRKRRLAEDDLGSAPRGILEVFDEVVEEPADEDAALARDAAEHDG